LGARRAARSPVDPRRARCSAGRSRRCRRHTCVRARECARVVCHVRAWGRTTRSPAGRPAHPPRRRTSCPRRRPRSRTPPRRRSATTARRSRCCLCCPTCTRLHGAGTQARPRVLRGTRTRLHRCSAGQNAQRWGQHSKQRQIRNRQSRGRKRRGTGHLVGAGHCGGRRHSRRCHGHRRRRRRRWRCR
jgi:hypothetical protein